MTDDLRDIRRPGWFWARNELIDRDGAALGVYGIAVYCVLARLAGDQQVAFPSMATIAEKLGCSPNRARKAIDALVELGWIRRVHQHDRDENGHIRRHRVNRYELIDLDTAPDGVLHQVDKGTPPGAVGVPHQVEGGTPPGAHYKETTTNNYETKKGSRRRESSTDNACAIYEDEKFGTLTPFVGERLGDLADTYGEDELVAALKIAVRQNKRKLAYVEGVLKRQAKEAGIPKGARRFVSGKYGAEIET